MRVTKILRGKCKYFCLTISLVLKDDLSPDIDKPADKGGRGGGRKPADKKTLRGKGGLKQQRGRGWGD